MNLIDRVEKLQKLEGRLQAIRERQNDPRSPNHAILEQIEIERKLLDAAPKLLSILSEIRAGDADEIDYAIQELSLIFGPDNVAETIEVLRRYQTMAAKMTEESK